MNLNYLQNNKLPRISIVIIGLNVEKFLHNCLRAVQNQIYPKQLLEIIYVDSGSSDRSIEIALEFNEVKIVKLDPENPSAAKGRNAGIKASTYEIIQFLDADSFPHPQWLRTAVPVLHDNAAAVTGQLHERYPDKNLYHRMANLEWNIRQSGNSWSVTEQEVRVFGGNVMITRAALLESGGYNEQLPAGEDPDLSYRIRQLGYKLIGLNQPMASHDICLNSLNQFNKRALRSGYAYSRLALKYITRKEKFMLKRVVRIVGGVVTPATLLILGILLQHPVIGLLAGLLVALRLVFKTGEFADNFNIEKKLAFQYSLYLAYSIYPQFLGVIKGFMETISRNGIPGFQINLNQQY